MKLSRARGVLKAGEIISALSRVVVEGPGVYIEGNQYGIGKHDFEGGKGGELVSLGEDQCGGNYIWV